MEGFAGKIALVTGAGSGIGRALAIELARSGAKLAISDVDTEGLAVTEERLNAIGAPVKSDRLDVTEREAFQVYADAVNDHYGKVNQIYNNAGIALIGDIEAIEFKDLERVMDVDYWGVVNGTKVFLPHAHHPVKVTCVHPGGIRTAIARNAASAGGLDTDKMATFFDKRLASTSPQKAARIILDGVRKNKARVLVGNDAKALDILARATGSGYQRLVAAAKSRAMPD